MTQRVLVPFDGSDPAWTALEEAVEQYPDAEIIALHVLDLNRFDFGLKGTSTGTGAGAGTDDLPDVSQEYADESLTAAEEFAEQYAITLTTSIETGPPARVIVDYATRHTVDRIVIGSHGRSGISRILLGSIAEQVVRQSPVSVTIAR
jgi:nucleotide-binding universal stress UspA family protein